MTIQIGSGSSQAVLDISEAGAEKPYARDRSRPLVFTLDTTLAEDLKKPFDQYHKKDLFESRPFGMDKVRVTRRTDGAAQDLGVLQDQARRCRRLASDAGGRCGGGRRPAEARRAAEQADRPQDGRAGGLDPPDRPERADPERRPSATTTASSSGCGSAASAASSTATAKANRPPARWRRHGRRGAAGAGRRHRAAGQADGDAGHARRRQNPDRRLHAEARDRRGCPAADSRAHPGRLRNGRQTQPTRRPRRTAAPGHLSKHWRPTSPPSSPHPISARPPRRAGALAAHRRDHLRTRRTPLDGASFEPEAADRRRGRAKAWLGLPVYDARPGHRQARARWHPRRQPRRRRQRRSDDQPPASGPLDGARRVGRADCRARRQSHQRASHRRRQRVRRAGLGFGLVVGRPGRRLRLPDRRPAVPRERSRVADRPRPGARHPRHRLQRAARARAAGRQPGDDGRGQ